MKVCICGVKKYPQLVWMAFVDSEEECKENEGEGVICEIWGEADSDVV